MTSVPTQPVVDTHAHFLPPSATSAAEAAGLWHGIQFGRSARGKITTSIGAAPIELPWPMPPETPQQRLASMDRAGIDKQMLSVSPTLYYHGLDKAIAGDLARAINDDLAEVIAGASTRFGGWGYLPLQDPAQSVVELERCMVELGLSGVMVGSHINGVDWDDASLFPVLEAAERLGAVVYVHPARGRASQFLTRYHLGNAIGNPMETAAALACLIFGGVFDRLPNLRTCFAHAGGYGVLGIGRLDHTKAVRAEADGIRQLPSDYVRSCWFDTITHDERALRFVIDTVGADRVVLGSDYPADMGDADPVALLHSFASLTEAEKSAILRGNSSALMGLL